MVQVHLLGRVAVTTDGGEPVDVGPAKCRAVLAALALSVADAVPVSRLVRVVWGEDPPRTADKTLQGYVARLRKGLGPDAIARTGAAYRLDLDPEAVDVARFRRHLAAGEVDAALATWTGPPLAGLDVPGLTASVEGLVEQWLGAVEDALGRRVATDPAATIAPLTELTADHPFREELWALLMTALYRAGRQADALAAYQRARHHLVEELGVEPGPRLRALEARILDHDDQLGGEQPPPRSASPGRGNLPPGLGRLVGRDAELDGVLEALAASPVVTLVGPGGIGKTTLALATARRWQADRLQRVWLVELAGIITSDDVQRAAGETLGVTEGPGGTLTDSILAALRSRPTLLVLDNCEHVIDGAAVLAGAVAGHAPETRVLATSREGLRVTGERLVAVGPLDPEGAAVELFTERAKEALAGFDLATSRADVAEICRRLDGVPLAIELAAARIRTMTPSELLARLDTRLRLLTGGRRAGPDRHRTLRATVGWSYDLLSPGQRRLFQRLSVFTGPFDLAAAEAVAAYGGLDAVDVDHLLGDLVERSMVIVEPGRLGRRFRLLETLRQFAAEHLAAQGEAEEAGRRHARWCRDQVARIHGLLAGPGEVEGVARLGELWPNLRAAVDWACTTGDVGLADALVRPIVPEIYLRRQAEIGDWAERILELTPRGDGAGTVFWLAWAASRHIQTGHRDAYERVVRRYGHADHPLLRFTHAYLYEDGQDLCEWSPAAASWLRAQGEDHAADLIELFGVVAGLMTTGRFAELDAVAATMADRFRAVGAPTLLHFALGMLGYSARFQGRPDAATRLFAMSADVELPAGTFSAHRAVEARAVFDQGERSRAFQMLRDDADALLDTDYVDSARMVAVEFVNMMAAVDRLAEAARVLAYLDTTEGFGVLARDTLVADAVAGIAAAPQVTGDGGPGLDARQALVYMRDVLDELAEEAEAAQRPAGP